MITTTAVIIDETLHMPGRAGGPLRDRRITSMERPSPGASSFPAGLLDPPRTGRSSCARYVMKLKHVIIIPTSALIGAGLLWFAYVMRKTSRD